MICNRLPAAVLIVGLGVSAKPHAAQTVTTTAPASTTLAIKLALLPAQHDSATIGSVVVDLDFSAIHLSSGAPLLKLALIADNVDTVATTLTGLEAHDTHGALILTARDVELPIQTARDSEAGGRSREWFSDRAPQGPITIRYSVSAMALLPPRGPAPPIGFSNDAGGVSAAGNVFLLMPPGQQRYAVTTAWDSSRIASDALGATSLGEGTAASRAPMTSAELRESYFMGGTIHRWPESKAADGFFSAWQGTPSFDAAALMRWTDDLHQHYCQFFGQKSVQPYGVFLRFNPVNAGGGTGFFHSFVMTFGAGKGSDPEDLKMTLAHEMFHTFSPYITQPAGDESSWFGEGLAMFYEARLPLRFHLITPEAFLADLNTYAGRYYTSIMATQPNSMIGTHFWQDTRIRTLAYDRGMLYFATIDDAVRKKSSGKRSLDDLLLRMLALEDQGKALSNADWEAVLRSQLGESAVKDFRESLNGSMPIPAPDAFGPCFTRTSARLRRYEVGFEPAVLAEPKRIIRGLVPGSAAEHAGLQNGDEIVKPVPQDEIQGNQTELLKLQIRRQDKEFSLTYLPRGEVVDAYQWKRVERITDDRCGL